SAAASRPAPITAADIAAMSATRNPIMNGTSWRFIASALVRGHRGPVVISCKRDVVHLRAIDRNSLGLPLLLPTLAETVQYPARLQRRTEVHLHTVHHRVRLHHLAGCGFHVLV